MNLPVSKRCDYKSIGASEKLILIDEIDICDTHHELSTLFIVVGSRLFQPLEISRRTDTHFYLRDNR